MTVVLQLLGKPEKMPDVSCFIEMVNYCLTAALASQKIMAFLRTLRFIFTSLVCQLVGGKEFLWNSVWPTVSGHLL